MELEEFQLALEDQGIDSRESGKSLAVEFCPACDRKKYKVIFRVVDVDEDEPFFGRCQSGSCKQNYSSISYLLKVGMERREVLELHGLDPQAALQSLSMEPTPLDGIKPVIKEKKQKDVVPVENDISKFLNIDSYMAHPVSKYAVKRGYDPRLREFIKLDTSSGAVVFVCRGSDGSVKGFQKRYMTVIDDGPKTYTSSGFIVADHIMCFPNKGPVVICEGPFTALAAWHWGFFGVSTLGSGVGPKQLELIEKIHKNTGREILVAVEDDEAGNIYWEKISNYFSWREISVKVILPEVGSDLNDAWQENKGYVIEDGKFIDPSMPNVSNFFGGI